MRGADRGGQHGAVRQDGVAWPIEDYPDARLIVLWGCNPSVSGIHLVPVRARSAEARREARRGRSAATPLARQADLHLAVRPGTDLPRRAGDDPPPLRVRPADLAFLARACPQLRSTLRERAEPWTFERAADVAGVSVERLRALRELYADRQPALIRCGWGLERNRNGGSAMAAVLALPAVAGKFGVRGGGFTMINSAAWDVDRDGRHRGPRQTRASINMNHLGDALTRLRRPPVRVLFVYNCNPVATLPEQNKVLRGLGARGPVHRRLRAGDDRHGTLRRRAAAGHDVPGTRRSASAATAPLASTGRSRSSSPWARPAPTIGCLPSCAGDMGLAREGDPETPARSWERSWPRPAKANGLHASSTSTANRFRPAVLRPVQFVDVFPGTADGKIDLLSVAARV